MGTNNYPKEIFNSFIEKSSIPGYSPNDDFLEPAPEPTDIENLSELMINLQQEGSEILDQEKSEPDQELMEQPLEIDRENTENDSIGMYLKEMSKVPLLSMQEEQELAHKIIAGRKARIELIKSTCQKISQTRKNLEIVIQNGLLAREHLIKANTRLVVSVAKKYMGRGVPFLDLIQEGNLGLMKAVEKFDANRGFRFSTYATWWIRQMITRSIDDQARTIRLPVHINDHIRHLYNSSRSLEQRLGRVPTQLELAEELNLEPRKLEMIIKSSRIPLSLDAPVGDEDDTDLGSFIEDEFSPTPMQSAYEKMLKEKVNEVLDSLSPRESRILRLRFGLDDGNIYTLEEVGDKFGLTRERIRQIEGKALRRLRHPHRARQLKEYL